jgi:hypothetical protein
MRVVLQTGYMDFMMNVSITINKYRQEKIQH